MQDKEKLEMEITKLLEQMQKDKIRVTPQRRAILKIILTKVNHPSVEEIYQQVQEVYPTMSLATVYNNVRAFVNAGILQELNFDEKTKRYDLVYQPHGHTICQSCGKIEDVFLDQFADLYKEISQLERFQVQSMEVSFRGLCQECLGKKKV
ncbi:Fur family transcriptional regulator [Facklamia miroungae]|uniref:Fur family transcriptional regulator, peroxide stress response regulator n=1 Tax=Facklamia miroungae TaxID=120956 RepID=A0A1G7TK53_9LACT|nr:transcriptional repressor [Facklamia miroungae]NKZ29805.1 transcriptional repressor [Facklamia miroungae]SDG35655.1 Fur family transcriptional regulator, peroxide stress response regulator [Facklamia miroungae]